MTSYFKGFPRAVNYPLYVPEPLDPIIEMLRSGQVSSVITEVTRLAALGSAPARAVLAYLHLCGAIDTVNLDMAESLAQQAAAGNSAYAQYVLAWIYFKRANPKALTLMAQSAVEGRFLPAQLDLGRWAQGGLSPRGPNFAAAEDAFQHAHNRGHVLGLLFLARLYLRGRRGLLKRMLGAALFPVALLRAGWQMARDPYSVRIFTFSPHRPLPFFIVPASSVTPT
jgi:TPR repeat protein